MGFDLITFLAQIFNFLLLVVLLRFLLYRPVVRAMDRRQQEIQSHLDEAEVKRKEAEQEAEAHRRQRQEIEAQRDEMLSAARKDAEAHRSELRDKARREVDEQRRRWVRDARDQRRQFLDQLRRQAADGLCAIARKTLADLADAELEGQVVEVFLRRIGKLDEEQAQAVTESAGKSTRPLTVHSAWEISAPQQKQIARALHKRFGDDREVGFEQSADVICGVELRTEGGAVGWNVHSYLDELAQGIEASLRDQAHQAEEADSHEPPPRAESKTAGADKPGAEDKHPAQADAGAEDAGEDAGPARQESSES